MKDTLNQALQEILDTLIATKDFVIEQAPDVVQQLLMWNTTACSIGTVVGLILLSVGFMMYYHNDKLFKENNKNNWDENLSAFWLILSVIGFIISMSFGFTLLKILIAPKLYVIEYIINMVK